jgi:glycopeptide antibiotics resistance protein
MRPVALLAWLLLVLVVTVPWASYVEHPHWSHVVWVPFSGPFRPFDIVLNVVLYMPLGFLLARRGRPWWGDLALAGLLALAVSTGVELSQVWSHARFPSATDVVMNVTGALLGVVLGRRARARR